MKRLNIILNFLWICFLFISCQGYEKKDGKWQYYYWSLATDKQIKPLNADDNSFEVIKEDCYAKDKNQVFYKKSLIKYANPRSFRIIDDIYSCDDKYVFFQYGIISGADPKSFVRLQFPFSKDKNDVYNGSIPMNAMKGSRFKIIELNTGIITSGIDEFFRNDYPEYKTLDTIKCDVIFYSVFSKTTVGDQKYFGVKKVRYWPKL